MVFAGVVPFQFRKKSARVHGAAALRAARRAWAGAFLVAIPIISGVRGLLMDEL
jgi:hypothetical protein